MASSTPKSEASGTGAPIKFESKGNPKDSSDKAEVNKANVTQSDSRLKTSSRVAYKEGYNYEGENATIGLILALPSEKLNNKVAYTTFIDKMKNYVLTTFEEGKDMMPILEFLVDPKTIIQAEEPTDLTIEEMKSTVKQWLKQEEVKQYSKRLKLLRHNKEKGICSNLGSTYPWITRRIEG